MAGGSTEPNGSAHTVRPPDADEALLVVEQMSKAFGPVQALASVDLRVAPGEIVALAGENGSGKSTLSKLIAGGLRPDSGTMTLAGATVAHPTPRAALDQGVALVSQDLTAVPHLSIGENVLLTTLAHHPWRVRRRELVARAQPFLARVGLDVDPRLPFRSLGPGQAELAEVAKALASHPRLLVLDEATTRLPDPGRLLSLLQELAVEGVASILVTHRLREIRQVADRAVVLRDGRVVGELARTELSDERLSSMMVGRELSEYHHKPRVDPGEVALQVEGLRPHRYRRPVSLTVRRGEIVGIAGLVGSGRSNLLETIAGARSPAAPGQVHLAGVDLARATVRRRLGAGLALLPEDRRLQGLLMRASIRENLGLGARPALSVVHRHEERARAATIAQRVQLRAASLESPLWSLSGGNQQKVLVGRLLALEPSVLLLDEPTRGVDIGAREEIYRLIGQMVADGRAVLVASSDLVELLGLADRIIVLHEGAVAGELARADATEERIALLSAGGADDVAA